MVVPLLRKMFPESLSQQGIDPRLCYLGTTMVWINDDRIKLSTADCSTLYALSACLQPVSPHPPLTTSLVLFSSFSQYQWFKWQIKFLSQYFSRLQVGTSEPLVTSWNLPLCDQAESSCTFMHILCTFMGCISQCCI